MDRMRKISVQQHCEDLLKVKADDLQKHLSEARKHAMAETSEKESSSTHTTIPVAELGFFL